MWARTATTNRSLAKEVGVAVTASVRWTLATHAAPAMGTQHCLLQQFGRMVHFHAHILDNVDRFATGITLSLVRVEIAPIRMISRPNHFV
jgi:hypothetical protein